MSPFSLFESPWLLCEAQLCALHVLALLNTMNYSTVVDQSDYSISTILYNNNYYYMQCVNAHVRPSDVFKLCNDFRFRAPLSSVCVVTII